MRPRILIIEDSPLIRRLVTIVLRPLEAIIDEAEDGPSGVAAVTSHHDLIILDIGLPGMDGWEVLSAIRSDCATSSIPVVVVTAHAQESMKRRAAVDGADAFLTKPFAPNGLLDVALRLLSGTSVHSTLHVATGDLRTPSTLD